VGAAHTPKNSAAAIAIEAAKLQEVLPGRTVTILDPLSPEARERLEAELTTS